MKTYDLSPLLFFAGLANKSDEFISARDAELVEAFKAGIDVSDLASAIERSIPRVYQILEHREQNFWVCRNGKHPKYCEHSKCRRVGLTTWLENHLRSGRWTS